MSGMSALDAKSLLTGLGLAQLGFLCWVGKVPGEALAGVTQATLICLLGAKLLEDASVKIGEKVAAMKMAREGK